MCVNAIFHINESFSFVPTSNIDSSAAAAIAAGFKSTGGSQKPMSWISFLKLELHSSQLKPVRFHLVYVVIVSLGILLARFYHASGISANCSEKFLLIGLLGSLLHRHCCTHVSTFCARDATSEPSNASHPMGSFPILARSYESGGVFVWAN